MAIDYDVPQDKRMLYWIGDKLIDYRHPVSIVVLAVTGLFAYWSMQLRLVTSFGELLPQSHGFPARMLFPDHYGMRNVKWLSRIELKTEDEDGYWAQRGWDKDAATTKIMFA